MVEYAVYGHDECKYCTMAKDLLESKSCKYSYIDIRKDTIVRDFIIGEGFKTVPVIYKLEFNEDGWVHVGGYKELLEEIG